MCSSDLTIREQTAYFIPTLTSPIDTSNFEEYEPLDDEEAHALHSQYSGGSPKEGGHTPVGARKIKVPTEKDLPFIGYTYKAFDIPKRAAASNALPSGPAGPGRRPTIEEMFESSPSGSPVQQHN